MSGLLPRSGSNSNITSLNVPVGPWHHTSPSPGFKKLHIKGSPTSDPGFCSRLYRTITGRRGGMLLGALVSLFSFLMLISIASRISIHFISPSGLEVINTWRIESDKETGFEGRFEGDKEAGLEATEVLNLEDRGKMGLEGLDFWKFEGDKETLVEVTDTGSMESSESDVQNIQATTMAARLLSEGFTSRANVIPEMHSNNHKNHSNLPRSLLSSDQPLPPGHPCQGFTLPPPPADKKRTGPRPCPVCYLPVKKAIEEMPPAIISKSSPVKSLSYMVELPDFVPQEGLEGLSFAGHPSLKERNKSFEIQEHMNVHCGFVRGMKPGVGTGFDIDENDLADMDKCTGIVVASAIFGNYDLLQQPRNISSYSRRNVCFFMFVDEETQQSFSEANGDKNFTESGVWKVVVVHNMPYKDARRNGKIPKLLLHRLFPNARFSLWIDGKLQLVVDPYQVLERFLWRQNHTFAISQHYKRLDVFEEAEANKAAGKYDNASIDAQINFYWMEGIRQFDISKSPFRSDVPEGCVIIREHTPITNLFTCLWFNEVDRFTSRDQLSFAIVRNKLIEKVPWRFNMFLDCERRNFVVQAYHKELLEQKNNLVHASIGQINGADKVTPAHMITSRDVGSVLQQHYRHISFPRKSQKHKRGSTF